MSPRAGRAGDLEEAAAVFTSLRPRLFGIAYRMLSSATEAEDLVQDVWLRWQRCDRSAVASPAAFLATPTGRSPASSSRPSPRCASWSAGPAST